MLHKQGAKLLLLLLGPVVARGLFVGLVLGVVAVRHLDGLFRALPEQQLHVGLGIAHRYLHKAPEYEAAERR